MLVRKGGRQKYLACAGDPHNLVLEGILGQALGGKELQVSIRPVGRIKCQLMIAHQGIRFALSR